MIFESSGSNFRFPLPLPKTQAELDVINGYPEFETMSQILPIRNKSDNFRGVRNVPMEFSFKQGGGLKLPLDITNYGLSLTRNRAILYGSYAVGPSTEFRIQDWHQLIDFMSLYIISKSLGGLNISHIDKFVFDGEPLSANTWKSLNRYGYSEIVMKMAKKYNDPSVVDASLLSAKQKLDSFITDTSLIEKTEIFKWLEPIFGISRDNQSFGHNSDCETFTMGFKSPYGILDPIMRIYSKFFNVCLEGRGSHVIKVKTLKGLENAVNGYFKKKIFAHITGIIGDLNDKMIDFVISQKGGTISKESLIQKFKPQIEDAISERFKQMLKVGQSTHYRNPNPLNLDEIADFIQTVKDNLAIDLEDSPDIANAITSEFIRILNSPYEHDKITPFIQTAMKLFDVDLNDPLTIADGIKRDHVILSEIYDKLDPQVVQEIFRIMNVDKNDMESIRDMKQMGLI